MLAARSCFNGDSLVSRVGEPRKMLRLLQSEIEAKRAAITARIAELAPTEAAAKPATDTHIDKRIDRIEALERRAEFAAAPTAAPSPTALDDQIAGLQQASAIEAELAALKATVSPAKKTGGKKRV